MKAKKTIAAFFLLFIAAGAFAETETRVNVSWQFDAAKSILELEFCSVPRSTDLNAEFFLVEKGSAVPIAEGILSGTPCEKKTVNAGASSFELVVLDYNSKRQFKTEIETAQQQVFSNSGKNCAELKGKECLQAQECNGAMQNSIDSNYCCIGSCENLVSSGQKGISLEWLSAAVIIIAILLAFGLAVRRE